MVNSLVTTTIREFTGMSIARFSAAAALLLSATTAPAAIEFTGVLTVPGAMTDLSGLPATEGNNRLSFGSDLIYDRPTNTFYGITDRGPGGGLIDYAPRANAFTLATDPTTGQALGFTLTNTTVFTGTDGTVFSGLNPQLRSGSVSNLGDSFDPEGLARLPNGNFLVADEYGPSVIEFTPTGQEVRRFTTPSNLVPRLSDGSVDYVNGRGVITTGRQDNRGFEGLTVSNDGTRAYAIMQDALVNEGRGGQGRRSPNLRIVEFDVATGQPTRQFIYTLESYTDINTRVPGQPFEENQQGRSIGASGIYALPDGSFLVIERDNRGLGVDDPTGAGLVGTKRIYRITLDGATDVSGVSLAGTSILPAGVTAVTKTLFLDINAALVAAGLNPYEKIEGISLGAYLPDGGISLYLVTDNDFSVTQSGVGVQFDVCTSGAGGTTSQVLLGAGCPERQSLIPSAIYGFAVTGADAIGLRPAVPEPSTWAMMLAGFGAIGGMMRRRRRALGRIPASC